MQNSITSSAGAITDPMLSREPQKSSANSTVTATSVESQIPATNNTTQGKSLEKYKISKKEITKMIAWTAATGTAGAGCGALAGSVAGAIIGLLGGPVGAAIGAAVGGLIGGLAGGAIATGICVRAYRNDPQRIASKKLEKTSQTLSKIEKQLREQKEQVAIAWNKISSDFQIKSAEAFHKRLEQENAKTDKLKKELSDLHSELNKTFGEIRDLEVYESWLERKTGQMVVLAQSRVQARSIATEGQTVAGCQAMTAAEVVPAERALALERSRLKNDPYYQTLLNRRDSQRAQNETKGKELRYHTSRIEPLKAYQTELDQLHALETQVKQLEQEITGYKKTLAGEATLAA